MVQTDESDEACVCDDISNDEVCLCDRGLVLKCQKDRFYAEAHALVRDEAHDEVHGVARGVARGVVHVQVRDGVHSVHVHDAHDASNHVFRDEDYNTSCDELDSDVSCVRKENDAQQHASGGE